MIVRREQEKAFEMLCELETQQLEVVLIPAPEKRFSTHCVRAVQSANPEWYQNFCSLYLSTRAGRPRTAIKRQATIHALEKLTEGKDAGIYGERLLEFIRREYFKPRKELIYDFDFTFGF